MTVGVNSCFNNLREIFSKHKINIKGSMRFFEIVRSLDKIKFTSLESMAFA